MSKTEPIKAKSDLERFRNYYQQIEPHPRNELLLVMGLNTALRIGDILRLTWKDVYDFERKCCRQHLRVREQKTGKENTVAINAALKKSLLQYKKTLDILSPDDYLFTGRKGHSTALCRQQAYRIVRSAATHTGIKENISCHSLRKTFGYHAWKLGTPPVLLMNIFNHSSYQITKRYLCIEQDERDSVFNNNLL